MASHLVQTELCISFRKARNRHQFRFILYWGWKYVAGTLLWLFTQKFREKRKFYYCFEVIGFYTFVKLVLFRLLVLVVRDSVIAQSAIAYNVNNNLDEVLLAIVCSVYYGNIITRSRLVLKVAVTRALVVNISCGVVEETNWIACWRSVSHVPTSLVEDCCFRSVRYSTYMSCYCEVIGLIRGQCF